MPAVESESTWAVTGTRYWFGGIIIFRCAVILVLCGLACQSGADSADITVLTRQIDTADSLAQRISILRELEVEVDAGNLRVGHINSLTMRLMGSRIIESPEAMSLLTSMLSSPVGSDETTLAVAGRMNGEPISPEVARRLFAMLTAYDADRGLPMTTFRRLNQVLPDMKDARLRLEMYRYLDDSDWASFKSKEFLPTVAHFLAPEYSRSERLEALDRVELAAMTYRLPSKVRSHLVRLAADDPDARFRIVAWSILRAQDAASGNRGRSMGLLKEIQDPTAEKSLYNAEAEVRERGVALILTDWGPDLSEAVVNSLISLVAETGSLTALIGLANMRQKDGLSDAQLDRLRSINVEDSDSRTLLVEIVTPALEQGSLLGPVEVMEYSRSPDERRRALELLLDRNTDDTVPDEVAEAAYQMLISRSDVPGAAGALLARSGKTFDQKERLLLGLVDRSPRPHGAVIRGLSTLNDDADIETLVNKYAGRSQITENFRASLVSELYQQTKEGAALRPETVAVLQELGESADNYGTVGVVIRVFESIDRPVSWTIRIRDEGFQWYMLGVVLMVSWLIAISGGVAWLIHLVVPFEQRQDALGARFGGFLSLFFMAVVFLGANVGGLLLSLGHTSSPPPNQAAPFYVMMFAIACAIGAIGISVWRKRVLAGRVVGPG